MPPYNAVNDFYLRQSQQYLNFPPHNNIPQVNCRFVTNRDEARASMIDGFSYNVFLDSSNGKIYLKKLNNSGMADFLTYAIEEEKNTDPLSEINSRLSRIENYIGGLNDKSVSNDVKSTTVSNTAVAEQNERYDATEPTGVSENARNDKWQKRK